ncbi:hypothetical protein AXX16_3465 [Serratia rubidaea]|nr:hypothetical protein AXX16_3465 [Serratia rubidaea]
MLDPEVKPCPSRRHPTPAIYGGEDQFCPCFYQTRQEYQKNMHKKAHCLNLNRQRRLSQPMMRRGLQAL